MVRSRRPGGGGDGGAARTEASESHAMVAPTTRVSIHRTVASTPRTRCALEVMTHTHRHALASHHGASRRVVAHISRGSVARACARARVSARRASLNRASTMPPPPRAAADAAADARAVFRRGPKASNAPPRAHDVPSSSQNHHHHLYSLRDKVPSTLARHARAWSSARGTSSANIPVAVWRPHARRAEVIRARGRVFHRFGCARGASTWLFPEECAFLVETERLALVYDETDESVVSVRGVYALMAREGINMDEYLTYAKLCRLGFAVRRFGASWTMDARESDWTLADGRGRWATQREDVLCVDTREAKRRRIDVESASASANVDASRAASAARRREATSRHWWPWSGAVEHAWLGPEIEKGVMVACETDDDGLAPVDLAPTFTVYQPNKNFSKKAPDDASFYVYASSAKPLTGRESQALLDCTGGKPVRVSTCRQSTVVMFTIAAPKVY